MTVMEAITSRKSVRKYESRKVEEEKLVSVLEAGRLAPSAKNQQSWKFILVRDSEKMKRMPDACLDQPFVGQAPAAIVVVSTGDYTMACGQRTAPIDCSIAMSFMILRAHELGLGTCWLGRFSAVKIKDLLSIPEDAEVVAVTPIGYPAEGDDSRRPRKEFDQVVSFDTYE